MINVHDYFSINWEATSEKIRTFLKNKVSYKVFADAMYVTERTVYNWCHNKANPPLDKLILIAKFFDVDLFDILILNGQMERAITKDDFEEADKRVKQRYESEKLDIKNNCQYEFKCTEEVIRTIIFNTYVKENYPITTLEEFLIILPLIEDDKMLGDILYRINGNVGINNDYVYKKLAFLYNRIPDSLAKKFAEFCIKYHLKYPVVHNISNETIIDLERHKLKEYYGILASDFIEMYNTYQEKLQSFIDRLSK